MPYKIWHESSILQSVNGSPRLSSSLSLSSYLNLRTFTSYIQIGFQKWKPKYITATVYLSQHIGPLLYLLYPMNFPLCITKFTEQL